MKNQQIVWRALSKLIFSISHLDSTCFHGHLITFGKLLPSKEKIKKTKTKQTNLPEEKFSGPLYHWSLYFLFCWFYKKEATWVLRFHFRIKIQNMMKLSLCYISARLRLFRLQTAQIWQFWSILKIFILIISLFFPYFWLPEKEAIIIMADPGEPEKFLSLWNSTTLRVVGKSVLSFLFILFFYIFPPFCPKLPSQI